MIGYMCLVDFECELGAAKGGNIVYPSERNLREERKCVDQCGIAKVRVIGVEYKNVTIQTWKPLIYQ